MFRAATEYALQHHLPVFYLAANSGARVGLANEVKQCLQVEWHNPAEPQKGFKYLYLSDEDYHSITGLHSNWGCDVSWVCLHLASVHCIKQLASSASILKSSLRNTEQCELLHDRCLSLQAKQIIFCNQTLFSSLSRMVTMILYSTFLVLCFQVSSTLGFLEQPL